MKNANGHPEVFFCISQDKKQRNGLSTDREPEKKWKFSVTDVQERGDWVRIITAIQGRKCLPPLPRNHATLVVIPAE